MKKFVEILSQMGVSEETQKQFVDALKEWQEEQRTTLNEELRKRLEKAKQVCVEQVEKEKKRIADKVEIFCESIARKAEREAKKQAAIGESRSRRQLSAIKSLINDEFNIGSENNADLQAVRTENKRLRARINSLMEENRQASKRAERYNEVAKQITNRNRSLEKQIAESVLGREKAIKESKTAPAKTKTTRKTISEAQIRKPKQEPADNGIAAIADSMDDGPAFVK